MERPGGPDQHSSTVPAEPERSANLVADLTRWLADQRVDAAAAARSRERWLRQQAGEEARFAGVLLDLAERGMPVLVASAGDRRWRGRVSAVGSDFVAVRGTDGADALVALDAVGAVRAIGAPQLTGGDRGGSIDMSLAEALLAMAADRPRVVLVAAGVATAGELRAVGSDVVTVRADGEGTTVYVPVASLQSVTVPR